MKIIKNGFEYETLKLSLNSSCNSIIELADSLEIECSDPDDIKSFEIKGSRLKTVLINHIEFDSVLNIINKLPDTIENFKLFDCWFEGNLEKIISTKLATLPNLKKMVIDDVSKLAKITDFKKLLDLTIGIDKKTFKIQSGYFKNSNLEKLKFYSCDYAIRKIVFAKKCPFPDSLKVLKFDQYCKIDKLGTISDDRVIRFLPSGLQRLELTITKKSETTLLHDGKSINLIPDVGILKLNIKDFPENGKQFIIPDSVYYLKLHFFKELEILDFPDFIGKNSELKQVTIYLHSYNNSNLEYILDRFSTLLRKVTVYIKETSYKTSLNMKNMRKKYKNLIFLKNNL